MRQAKETLTFVNQTQKWGNKEKKKGKRKKKRRKKKKKKRERTMCKSNINVCLFFISYNTMLFKSSNRETKPNRSGLGWFGLRIRVGWFWF